MSHLVYCYYYSIKVVHNKQIHSFVYLIQSEGRKEITGFENMMGQRNMIDGWVCKNVNEISHYMQKSIVIVLASAVTEEFMDSIRVFRMGFVVTYI